MILLAIQLVYIDLPKNSQVVIYQYQRLSIFWITQSKVFKFGTLLKVVGNDNHSHSWLRKQLGIDITASVISNKQDNASWLRVNQELVLGLVQPLHQDKVLDQRVRLKKARKTPNPARQWYIAEQQYEDENNLNHNYTCAREKTSLIFIYRRRFAHSFIPLKLLH